MRRVGFIGVLTLVLVALAAPGVSAHSATTSFGAHASNASQGDSLNIQAKVKHAPKGSTFSATAVVHFASGDVTVALTRHGRSFVAGASVPVATDEALGPVTIDVAILFNSVEQDVQTTATVEAADDQDSDGSDDPGDDGGDALAR